jgi:hypothetical protein
VPNLAQFDHTDRAFKQSYFLHVGVNYQLSERIGKYNVEAPAITIDFFNLLTTL